MRSSRARASLRTTKIKPRRRPRKIAQRPAGMGGLKLTFKLGPKKPPADGDGDKPPPSGGGGGGDLAALKAKLEREQAQLRSALEKEAKAKAAKGAVAAAAKAVASDAPAPVIRGVPKALVMKGVPKALGGGGGSANAATKEKIHAVADGKVGKKKTKKPVVANAAVAGAAAGAGLKVKIVKRSGVGASGLSGGSAAAAAAAALASDAAKANRSAAPPPPPIGDASGKKRWRDEDDWDDAEPSTSAQQSQQQSQQPSAAVPAFNEPAPKSGAMLDVVKKLQAKDKQGVFAEPVTEAIAPGYFALIPTPMDFRTVKENVRLGKYTAWDLFVTDVEQIYANAMAYNLPGTVFHVLAAKTSEQSKKIINAARNAALTPKEKRARMAHTASLASLGGAGGSVMTLTESDAPSASRGGGTTSAGGTGTGAGDDDDDDDDDDDGDGDGDDEAGGGMMGREGADGGSRWKKKKQIVFKRHTFAERSLPSAIPSLSSLGAADPPPTPQTLVHPTPMYFQALMLPSAYADGLKAWGDGMKGRARRVATRLSEAMRKIIPPPPPPKPPTPEPATRPEQIPMAGIDDDESDDDDGGGQTIASMAAAARSQVARPAGPSAAVVALANAAAAAAKRAAAAAKQAASVAAGTTPVGASGDPLTHVNRAFGVAASAGLTGTMRAVHRNWEREMHKARGPPPPPLRDASAAGPP